MSDLELAWTQTDETLAIKAQQRPAPVLTEPYHPPCTQEALWLFVSHRPGSTVPEIAHVTGFQENHVRASLHRLARAGRMQRILGGRGSGKPSVWRVVETR